MANNLVIIFSIESFIALLFTYFLYFYFIKKNLNIIVSIICFITWYSVFLLTIILLYDISNKDDKDIHNIINIAYNIIYYIIFFDAWFIIPFLQLYESAGDFTIKGRIKRSLKNNLIYYLCCIIVCIICSIFIIFNYKKFYKNTDNIETKNKFQTIIDTSINLANMYGLILIVLLLSYSLVKFPKYIHRYYNNSIRIKYLEWSFAKIEDKLEDTKEVLKTYMYIIQSTLFKIKMLSKELNDLENEIKIIYDDIIENNDIYEININKQISDSEPVESVNKLIEINSVIKTLKSTIIVLKYQKIKIFKEWLKIKSALALSNEYNDDSDLTLTLNHKSLNDFEPINLKKNEIIYILKIRPILILIIEIILITFCVIIFISEITLFLKKYTSFSLLGYLINLFSNNLFLLHFAIFLPILFMFFLCFFTLFNMKISGYYGMYGNRHTDSHSILFISSLMCKICFSLCLNVVEMIAYDSKNPPILLQKFMNIKETKYLNYDIYKYFSLFCPLLMIVLVSLNYYNAFGKLMNVAGMNSFDVDSEERDEQINDGKDDLKKMLKNYNKNLIKDKNLY
jgi:hypothetical protein